MSDLLKSDPTPEPDHAQTHRALEAATHTDSQGVQFWQARDLMYILGYDKWQNFLSAIERAMEACEGSGRPRESQFRGFSKMAEKGGPPEQDYILSRYACYLVAMNGDTSKPPVAAAQTYFAIQTRRAELVQADDQRLALRGKVTEANKTLSGISKEAGVAPHLHGVRQDEGYKGFYGGHGLREVEDMREIPHKEGLLNMIGEVELAGHFFRLTQTGERLKKEGIQDYDSVIRIHREVGESVRNTMIENSGHAPERLPLAEPIKVVEKRVRQRKKALPPPGSSGS